MSVWCLGSINIDLVYDVPHLPGPGETIAASSLTRFLGGKGANMSVAAARAAAHVAHIGAVGPDGHWAAERLLEYGVDTRHIRNLDVPTGHAIIAVDPWGENQILVYPGANRALSDAMILGALAMANPGDLLLLQNETNGQVLAASTAKEMGLGVAYAAAPFDAQAVLSVLPHLDLLVMNAVEAEQLEAEMATSLAALPVNDILITLGADGCRWIHTPSGDVTDVPAFAVTPVDTTGAGDTFTGYVVAGLDRGLPMPQALSQAMRAAAIMVTRKGTADVIPDLRDVQDFSPDQ